MDKVKKRLKNNGRVLIFPEGTRSKDGNYSHLNVGHLNWRRKRALPLSPAISMAGQHR